MEYIANTGVSIDATGAPWTPGNITPIPVPGTTLIDGSPNIGDKLPFTASGCSLSGYTFVIGSGGGSISATSVWSIDGKKTMRKGDKGTCNGKFILSSPPGTSLSCSCMVEIDDAGQTAWKCD